MDRSKLCVVIAIVAAFSGCGRHGFVRDDARRPIGGAAVQVIYPSFNGPRYTTDRNGDASLGSQWPFDVYGIRIANDGFDSDEYPWPGRWPLDVTLHPGSGRRLFDSERPIRSTRDMLAWQTSKPSQPTRKSQISHVVFDSSWEATEAFA